MLLRMEAGVQRARWASTPLVVMPGGHYSSRERLWNRSKTEKPPPGLW